MPSLIKLPAANTWNRDTGVGVDGNTLELEVGSGGFDANSQIFEDTGVLPQAPWVDRGPEFAGIVDGEILEINDDSSAGGSIRVFDLGPPDWNEDLSVGLTVHLKLRCPRATGDAAMFLRIADGLKLYDLYFFPVTVKLVGTSSNSHVIAKYTYQEYFITVNSNVASFWIFNTITQTWDLLRSGLAAANTAVDILTFGAGSSTFQGRSFWNFVKFKSAIEATPFKSTSPVAEMAAPLVVGTTIDQIDIAEVLGTGANIKYQYNIGAGYNGSWITLAALRAALVGTAPPTLRLKVQFNSNGLGFASLNLNGSLTVLASEVCDNPAETDVRLGIVYDFGNLTGNYEPADAAKYLIDEQYGANGTEFTGELVLNIKGPIKVLKLDTGIKVIKI